MGWVRNEGEYESPVFGVSRDRWVDSRVWASNLWKEEGHPVPNGEFVWESLRVKEGSRGFSPFSAEF